MEIFNPHEFAEKLTPEQFELLLRAYIKRQTRDLSKKNTIFFFVQTEYGVEGYSKFNWQIGSGYGNEDPKTEGEILTEVIEEHSRRLGFTSTLRQIEHTPHVEPEEQIP